ncbi:hypothetical protein GGS23DRAFT_324538 [Durotheca rogersii]|uniref:uncharacterized protein n=1 Tax=Durotheca rogersii TaxID=419775 RepID=UPI00221FF407|nr:uncharacterized protein GGS23DRAFT_324538 [Durotheca rogersii]KAI5859369.1 hypothetical protein GGS23DRAFT_324538 [Durotheca rogersii]
MFYSENKRCKRSLKQSAEARTRPVRSTSNKSRACARTPHDNAPLSIVDEASPPFSRRRVVDAYQETRHMRVRPVPAISWSQREIPEACQYYLSHPTLPRAPIPVSQAPFLSYLGESWFATRDPPRQKLMSSAQTRETSSFNLHRQHGGMHWPCQQAGAPEALESGRLTPFPPPPGSARKRQQKQQVDFTNVRNFGLSRRDCVPVKEVRLAERPRLATGGGTKIRITAAHAILP